MDIRQLTPDLAVGPQITLEDVGALARVGIRTLINNRPDSEVVPELRDDAMRRAAQAAGMSYHYIPFEPGQITPEMVAAMDSALHDRRPAVAYCRSGNRCTVLWALTQAGHQPREALDATAARAGYDLSPVGPIIDALAQQDQ